MRRILQRIDRSPLAQSFNALAGSLGFWKWPALVLVTVLVNGAIFDLAGGRGLPMWLWAPGMGVLLLVFLAFHRSRPRAEMFSDHASDSAASEESLSEDPDDDEASLVDTVDSDLEEQSADESDADDEIAEHPSGLALTPPPPVGGLTDQGWQAHWHEHEEQQEDDSEGSSPDDADDEEVIEEPDAEEVDPSLQEAVPTPDQIGEWVDVSRAERSLAEEHDTASGSSANNIDSDFDLGAIDDAEDDSPVDTLPYPDRAEEIEEPEVSLGDLGDGYPDGEAEADEFGDEEDGEVEDDDEALEQEQEQEDDEEADEDLDEEAESEDGEGSSVPELDPELAEMSPLAGMLVRLHHTGCELFEIDADEHRDDLEATREWFDAWQDVYRTWRAEARQRLASEISPEVADAFASARDVTPGPVEPVTPVHKELLGRLRGGLNVLAECVEAL